ncbi:MAG: DUF4276 family protein [Candidatus Sumerlaeota bacterium]|nr:DUF4276 family protein [Candidatus Sumerlaeota bacterium]
MTISHIEVLVEEPSMEAALRILLPRLLGELTFGIYSYQCKTNLLEKLPERLRGYRSWLPKDWRIVVIMDRDDDDCCALKQRMEKISSDAGFVTRATAKSASYCVVNRLAIEELEAWYFGDWQAVRLAYPRVPETIPQKAPFRDPDAIRGGTWEAFERVLKNAGYCRNGLRKIEAARTVAEHWNIEANTSCSFQVFRDVLREMVAQ